LFIAFIAMVSGCNNAKKAREAAELDSLKQFYLIVKDSLDSTWNFMIAEDDLKLTFMKRLLEEITHSNSYDEETVNSLVSRIEDARLMRYDRQSMGNQNLIDEYDFAINSLIKEITALARSNPRYQNFPSMAQLIEYIQETDERVLLHRVHYDFFAKDYNKFINEHGELAKEIDGGDPQNKVNLFQISE